MTQCKAGQGRAGQGRVGQGRAGQCGVIEKKKLDKANK